LKTVSKTTSICGSIFDGFGTGFGGFSTPKMNSNRYQFQDRFLDAFWDQKIIQNDIFPLDYLGKGNFFL